MEVVTNRRIAPIPPVQQIDINNNITNNNNNNIPIQVDSNQINYNSSNSNGMDIGNGNRSSSRIGSNGSSSPIPLSPSEGIEVTRSGGTSETGGGRRSTSPNNLLPNPSPPNTDSTAFSDYDSPSLSSIASTKSIASVKTATLLTATRLSSSTMSLTPHNFGGTSNGGGLIPPIREEVKKVAVHISNPSETSSEGESKTSGFELVDDLPNKKLSNLSSPRRLGRGGRSSGINGNSGGDLLIATGNGNSLDRPSIQQSDSYNSIDSSGWKTDSSSDSPAFTSVMDMLGPHTRKLSNAPWDTAELSGPKARKLSKAPWEDDDADSIMSVSSYAPSTKENTKNVLVKPKSTLRSRSRSFSAIGSKRGHSEDGPSEESYQQQVIVAGGLGEDLAQNGNFSSSPPVQTLSRSPKGVKDRLTASRGDSILEITDQTSKPWAPIMIRKGSSNSDLRVSAAQLQQPLTYTDPSEVNQSQSLQQSSQQQLRPGYSRAGSSENGLTPISIDRNLPPPTANSNLPHSAPPHMTSFSPDDKLAPRSVSAGSSHNSHSHSQSRSLHSTSPTNPSFPPPTNTNISAPFSAVMGYDGIALTSGSGPGYKLISLETARQRETERIAAAAAVRYAQFSLENRPETSYSTHTSSGNNTGSRKSSNNKEESSSSKVAAPPTLKNKRSGFLKRMLGGGGGDKVVPPLPTTSPRLESEETFRVVDDEYDIGSLMLKKTSLPTNNSPIVITLASPLPSLHSNSTFTSSASIKHLNVDSEEDSKPKGLAPSLALRPISMFTGFGLPDGFLSQISNEDIIINEEETPRIRSTQSPRGAIPSPLALTPSTSFPFLASPTDSNTSTPLAPQFPSSITHSTLHAPSSSPSSSSSELKSLPSPITRNNPMSYYEPQALETYTELQQRFNLATLEWRGLQEDYELQIKELRAEVEKYKLEGVGVESATQSFVTVEEQCLKCHLSKCICILSVLQRPRFIGNGGEGALFSG